jgi:hypothetical protein
MDIKALRIDSALKQKKGLHFILASVILWSALTILHISDLPILTKNLYTFFLTAPLVPLAFLISKLIRVDFQNKSNPLTDLGILFSMNQMLYLIIAMWIFSTVPDKMLNGHCNHLWGTPIAIRMVVYVKDIHGSIRIHFNLLTDCRSKL